ECSARAEPRAHDFNPAAIDLWLSRAPAAATASASGQVDHSALPKLLAETTSAPRVLQVFQTGRCG
ncbi:hypothetical protein, partial [Nocardia salmonicida]|uniref:hypothetical protein n=1 Tax=Nocardia salmonicida TaxID=53431 RepID=UPI00364CB164